MRKISRVFAVCAAVFLLFTGCGGAKTSDSSATETTATEEYTTGLKAPEMLWWKLYNPNGFDTITAVIRNPNHVAIDVSYDLVYYKNGAEVARNEDFCGFSIMPEKQDVVWGNFDIPKAEDVDNVQLENVTVTETYYPPIDGKYTIVSGQNGKKFAEFTFDSDPTIANISVLFYNDYNKNEQCDKEELAEVGIYSITDKTDRVELLVGYDYDVYFTAY